MKIPRVPYWPFIVIPPLVFGIGFAMNLLAMTVNGGQMPVLISGGCVANEFRGDWIHRCMTPATHLKFLCDWIIIKSVGTASPGDLLEWFYQVTGTYGIVSWFVLTVNDLQKVKSTSNGS